MFLIKTLKKRRKSKIKKSSLITLAVLAASSPDFASGVRTADCDAEIAECYRTISATCPGGFKIIDRNSFSGDSLVRDLPPHTLFFGCQYNTVVYQCACPNSFYEARRSI